MIERSAAIALVLSLLFPAWTAAAEPAQYAVLMAGKPAGSQQITVLPEGEVHVAFQFNDRGRGPELESRYRFDEAGIPQSVETEGHDYLKAPVDERFSSDDAGARWENRSEQGERALAGPAFYLSLDGPPIEVGFLARALLRAPTLSLPLLPAGEARIERVGETDISTVGESRTVTLYEISGLGFQPTPIWLESDGTYLGTVSEWISVLPKGWEASAKELIAYQNQREQGRSAELAAALARRPAEGIVFTGAGLFDAETGTIRPQMTVLVQGRRIAAVGQDGTIKVPAEAVVVDASGKTLLPGLWDMHTHLSRLDGLLHLAAGVTSVRDLANDIDLLRELKESWETGTAIGPRVIAAGFMDGPGPFAGPTKVLVDTPDEARAWVDRYAEVGYEQIKIYSSIKPELVPAIVARAHERGLRVSGHIPAGMWAEDAVREGLDEIQHANMLFLNFYKDVEDTRTPARFIEVAKRGADLDLDSPEVRSFIELLRTRYAVVDPTVSIFEGMFTDRPGTLGRGFAAVAGRLPPQVRRSLLRGGLPVPEGMDQHYRDSFRRMLDLVALLHRQGVRLVAGTDNLAGFALHRELELYVDAGIPAPEVLRLATLGAAQVTGRAADLGSIAPGKLADLVLVQGDPVADIGRIRGAEIVVKDGVLFDVKAIYAAVGVAPVR